jgi:hypothetical protein
MTDYGCVCNEDLISDGRRGQCEILIEYMFLRYIAIFSLQKFASYLGTLQVKDC